MRSQLVMHLSLAACIFGCGIDESKAVKTTASQPPYYNPKAVESNPDGATLEEHDTKNKSDFRSAIPSLSLYEPKITRLRGKIVERHDLAKMHKYYLVSDTGEFYALDKWVPANQVLNTECDVIGVSMVPTPRHAEQLVLEANSQMLPGQSIPESPIKGVLHDVSVTAVGDE